MTVSVGGAIFDPSCSKRHDVLTAADAAMYEAKHAGRDRCIVFSGAEGLRARAQSGQSWEHRIMDALDSDGFELYCQPLLRIEDGDVSRYELLLRMNVDGEVVAPGDFLPVAERLGLIHAIDRWVSRQAIRLLAAHPHLEFEVNLSGRSLDDPEPAGHDRRGPRGGPRTSTRHAWSSR